MNKTKLEVVQKNLSAAELLVNNGYALQSFFLTLPMLELIGKFLNRDKNKELRSGVYFTDGFDEIFKNENTISKSHIFVFYDKIRCGLFHDFSLKEKAKNKNEDSVSFASISVASDSSTIDSSKISIGAKDINFKLNNYFNREDIKKEEFFLMTSFEYDENNPAVSGTSVSDSVQI